MSLVTMREILPYAEEKKIAIPAFNIDTMEITQAILETVEEENCPAIIAVGQAAIKDGKLESLAATVRTLAKDMKTPVVLHLDHGQSVEQVVKALCAGFTSVMIDGSKLSFEDNIALTRQVVEYAHDHGVVVEGELGTLAGVEDEVKVSAEDSSYTRPDEVEEFVNRTGVDSLAIAIGTSHGAYKFTAAQCTRNEKGILVPPPLRFDILDEVAKRLPGFPIVLHGSSSVPQEFVKIINENGGKMPDAVGIPEEQLRKAAEGAVCKINIDSDLRLAMTACIRQYFNEHPDHFDPRQYLKPARAAIKAMVEHKLVDVLGCDGKA